MSSSIDIATRASVVALKARSGKTTREVAFLTGLSVSSVNRIYARAIKRGFDPDQVPLVIRDEHVKDGVRSGRPRQQAAVITEKALAKPRGIISHYNLEDSPETWPPQDEANEEAWVDTEDEKK